MCSIDSLRVNKAIYVYIFKHHITLIRKRKCKTKLGFQIKFQAQLNPQEVLESKLHPTVYLSRGKGAGFYNSKSVSVWLQPLWGDEDGLKKKSQLFLAFHPQAAPVLKGIRVKKFTSANLTAKPTDAGGGALTWERDPRGWDGCRRPPIL